SLSKSQDFSSTTFDNFSLTPKTAYIPQYTERGSKFYGPRRFVAIKPKEIAIADSGYNMVMPDAEEKRTVTFLLTTG
ncbi:MAG: hypothetical protein ACI4L0_01955, partial [Treponema sp.]